MNRRLSRVEIQRHAEFVQYVAKSCHEVTERLLPNIETLQTTIEFLPPHIRDLQTVTHGLLPNSRGLQTVTERAKTEAEYLWKIGERLARFDETLHPQAGFAPYWSHVKDSKASANDLETNVQNIQGFVEMLSTDDSQLQKTVQCLQSDTKGLEMVEKDLRRILQFGAV